jgi:hypothetical protein
VADQKKAPPANVDELKARLGLVKKPDAGQAKPGAGPAKPAAPAMGGPALPGIKPPPGVAPPPFLQPQKKAADMHRDPFAKDVGTEYVRQSLVEGPKKDDLAVSIDDQKKIQSRARVMTIIVAVAVGIAGLLVGMFWGRGFSSRLIYNRSVDDGIVLYDVLQYSSKMLSSVRTKLVSAQQKANQKREADFVMVKELKTFAKAQGCETEGENETCVLRLADLANRSYNIYKPDIVQLLFTYSSQWNDLFELLEEHATRTKNDQPALEQTAKTVEKLFSADYGIIFTSKTDPQTEMPVIYGNLGIITAPIMSKEGQVKGFQIQGGTGYPSVEKDLYNTGDLAAEPENWIMPLGPESLEGVIAMQKISHFVEYQRRLQAMIELANQMDQNQKALLMSLGEIASLDKQFAF